jgi:recombining binding protein (suppressor of hairless)
VSLPAILYLHAFCDLLADTPIFLVPQPVTYGSEIILMDTHSGISTAPLVIRKVDKGKIVTDDGGPVSQMQKIALQRINQDGTRHYLSAAGPMPGTAGTMSPTPGQAGSHPLIFQSPRVREDVKDGVRTVTDEVDDYLCWTIVGICKCRTLYYHYYHVLCRYAAKFQYTFFDALGPSNTIPELPVTPFPTLFTAPVYRPANNALELTVSNFFYENPKTRTQTPLDVYLGSIGPLRTRIYQTPLPGPLTNVSPFVQPLTPPVEASAGAVEPQPSSNGAPNSAPPIPPRYISAGPLHTIVVVEMPPLADVINALKEDVVPSADEAEDRTERGNSAQESGEGERDSGISPAVVPQQVAGRSLPLLFIRALDGVGYHSGRTIACENVFENMTLNVIGGGPGGSPNGIDQSWLAAAQAAAAVDGGLHGWTLRVM